MGTMTHYRFWVQNVLPLVYDDSLSYYEVLAKCVDYINNLIDSNNETIENMDELEGSLEEIRQMIEDAGIADVAEIKADVAQLKTDVGNINTEISEMNTDINNLENGKAPTNHRSQETTYGAGNLNNYGHVKLYGQVDSDLNATGGTAATPSAVKKAYNKVITVEGTALNAVSSGVIVNVTDNRITSNHKVACIECSDYSVINSNLSWTTADGSVSVSGTCLRQVTLYITLVEV